MFLNLYYTRDFLFCKETGEKILKYWKKISKAGELGRRVNEIEQGMGEKLRSARVAGVAVVKVILAAKNAKNSLKLCVLCELKREVSSAADTAAIQQVGGVVLRKRLSVIPEMRQGTAERRLI